VDSTTESVVAAVVVDSVVVVAGHARTGVTHGRDMLRSRGVTHWFPSVCEGSEPAKRSPSTVLPMVFLREWTIGRHHAVCLCARACPSARLRVVVGRGGAARPERARRKFPREPLGGVGGERARDDRRRAAVETAKTALGDETADEVEGWKVARTAGTFALVDGFGVVEREDGEPGDDAGGAAARRRGERFEKQTCAVGESARVECANDARRTRRDDEKRDDAKRVETRRSGHESAHQKRFALQTPPA